MGGRDPHETHRVTTPLELLFVVAYGMAADELAHYLADGHVKAGIIGFTFAAFGITWAWINFSWFSWAFDVDDWISVAQVGWIVLVFAHTSILVTFIFVILLTALEFTGPYIAETRRGGTPWHAHHLAERYGLLIIIALGEGIIGAIASLSAVVGPEGPGWSVSAAVVAFAGVGLTFGLWWAYFVIPFGDFLHARREKSFGWGYGNVPVIAAVVAGGGGLHVAAYYIEHHSELGAAATILTTAIPVGVAILGIYGLYAYLVSAIDGWMLQSLQ
ncbi:low temperature requirement protein A [Solirubrobacter sp. CPCC 204708]|uniref:Low temperature requirement protein A n=1 Tax=Solirubrobacter deserti TaxID=2282478 RepID=A0ABT4REA1_9ACTN|nr:low temperature requirement protein A [Solirubrobacter deserti]MBE2316114.1 low temperature requirement protein A [Solirubrobacter deserti]MDA0136864.1 low temperature requirement protein A [Solirubrobacter deserti]